MTLDKKPQNLSRYNALQWKEIEEHRYHLSEKAGEDVGIMIAVDDWANTPINKNGTTHAIRFNRTYYNHEQRVQEACDSKCGPEECYGAKECDFPKGRLHEILED